MALTGQENFSLPICIGAIAADGNTTCTPLFQSPSTHQLNIKSIKIAASAAGATDSTNYQDVAIKTIGGTCLAWYSNNGTGGSALVAGEFIDMTLIVRTIPSSTDVYVDYTMAGTGTAFTGVCIQIDAEAIV